MGTKYQGIQNHRSYGDAILARLKAAPAALKKAGAVFGATQKALSSADDSASAAKTKRDEALVAIRDADAVLDLSVDALATTMVAAGLTKRARPFQGFSSRAPSEICSLAYATEVSEVTALIRKVLAKKPAATVTKACAVCTKNAKAVTAALASLTLPQNDYNKALTTRDALLPAWDKSLRTLKKHASLAFDDAQGDYDALFASPESVQAPVKKRAKKAAPPATPRPASPPAPTTPAD